MCLHAAVSQKMTLWQILITTPLLMMMIMMEMTSAAPLPEFGRGIDADQRPHEGERGA